MTSKELIENIRKLVGKSQLDKAIDLLENWTASKGDWQNNDIILLIKSDFQALQNKKIKGTISNEEERRITNDIADRILTLANKVGLYKKSKPPRSIDMSVESMPEAAGAEPNFSAEIDMPISNIEPAKSMSLPRPSASTAPTKVSMATPPSPQPSAAPIKGGLLYDIPKKMPMGIETKCIVRIAFDKTFLKNTTDVFQSPVEMEIRVAELMEVELKELGSNNAFEITPLNDKQQFLDGFSATEWQFYVKPLKIGSYKLLLKVAIIERINDVDRRKEAVLEQSVSVTTEGGAATTTLQSFMPNFKEVSVDAGMKTILFMGANPPGTSMLQLEVEHSRIVTKLEGKFKFPTEKFTNATDIPELIIKNKPSIIHFSGHGKDPKGSAESAGSRGIGYAMPKNYEKTGGIIVFDNDMRGMKIIEDDVLEYVFDMAVNQLGIPIEVVVFNSCHSESQAKVIGKHVPYVVGTSRAIEDTTAIAFATGFYFGVANNLPIEKAFTSGKMQAVIADKKAKNLIVLYKNGKKMKL